MALVTTIAVQETNNGEPVDKHQVLRRSYDRVLHTQLTVDKTRKPLPTAITDIQYVYIRCEGGTVKMFRNLSPEALKFDTLLLLSGLEECRRLTFEAVDSEVELDIYIAGS